VLFFTFFVFVFTQIQKVQKKSNMIMLKIETTGDYHQAGGVNILANLVPLSFGGVGRSA